MGLLRCLDKATVSQDMRMAYYHAHRLHVDWQYPVREALEGTTFTNEKEPPPSLPAFRNGTPAFAKHFAHAHGNWFGNPELQSGERLTANNI